MTPTILLYNMTNPRIRRTLQMLSIKSGIRIKSVDPDQYGMTIGDLLNGNAKIGIQVDASATDAQERETFDEAMMVFAGVSGPAINQFLGMMAKNKIPRVSLKAMLTETNASWNSVELYKELKEEDAKMHQK